MLQPRDIFAGIAAKDVPALKRKSNDTFWIIPISDYAKILTKALEKKVKNIDHQRYLKLIVRHSNGEKGLDKSIEQAFKDSKLSGASIAKDFGEMLAPFYAATYLDKFMQKNGVKVSKQTIRATFGAPGKKVDNVCFPTRQNFEIFDFFIQNGYYFGFSVKASGGSSNTFSPTYIKERLDKLPQKSAAALQKESPLEFNLLSILGTESGFAGPVKAFNQLLINKGNHFESIDRVRAIFKEVSRDLSYLDSDALLIERAGKDKPLDKLNLKGYNAYNKFMNEFVIDATEQPPKTKEQFKSSDKQYTTTNLVYGFIKYVAKPSYSLGDIFGTLFPDLNVVKVGISRKGVPELKLVTTVKISDSRAELKTAFDMRSKARFSKVKDKLGLQL